MSEFTEYALMLTSALSLGELQAEATTHFGASLVAIESPGSDFMTGIEAEVWNDPTVEKVWAALEKPRYVNVITQYTNQKPLPQNALRVFEGEDFASWILTLPKDVAPYDRYVFLGQPSDAPDIVDYADWVREKAKSNAFFVITHPELTDATFTDFLHIDAKAYDIQWAATLPDADLSAIAKHFDLEPEALLPSMTYGGLREFLPLIGATYHQMLDENVFVDGEWDDLPRPGEAHFSWEFEDINYF